MKNDSTQVIQLFAKVNILIEKNIWAKCTNNKGRQFIVV